MRRNTVLALSACLAMLACDASRSAQPARGASAGASSSGLRVQYRTSGTSASTNTIAPWISVANGGPSAVSLSSITVRYWFTADGAQTTHYYCDWAPIAGACANVTAKVVKMASATAMADTYLELGFSSSAGSLAAGQSTGDIQSRMAKSDWSNFDQSNDYSFDPTKTAPADWDRVTLYQDGALIWGAEPGGTPPTCAAAPPAPTVTATATSSSAIDVTWAAVTPPAGCAVTYEVYRSTTSGFTPSAANRVAAGLTTTSSVSTGLAAGTTYHFVVRAVDAFGSTSSAQVSAATQSGSSSPALKVQYHVSTAAPSPIQLTPLIRIVNGGSAPVALSTLTIRYWYTEEGTQGQTYACDYWANGCANVTARFVRLAAPTAGANHYLELGFTSGAGSLAAGASTTDIQSRFAKTDYSAFDQTNDWSYDGTKLAPADWNHVTLYQDGVLVWGIEAGVDTAPPTAPTHLTAASTNSVSVTLTWTAATDDTGVVGYDVYKGAALDGTTTSTTYKATGLTPSTAYGFTVRARDAWGNASSPSAVLSVTTSPPDDTPPSAPTGLTAASVTSTSASLTWDASTDDVGVVAYDVYSGSTLAGSPTTTSFTAIGLSPSTSYSFTVRARDAAGNASAASAPLGVATPASGGGSYALDPPDACYSQYVVAGCTEGVASSTCGGHCRVANACSPPEDPAKGNLPMTFACPRFMTFSDEMVQAARDDWGDTEPFVYGVVGHDADIGGLDTGTSSCCQCYQLVFESGEPAISQSDPVAIPKPMIVQSFNTAAGGGKNFDIYMGGGGFGAFNACIPGTYAGTQTTNFGHFMYTAFPSQYPTNGGIKAINLDQCKVNSAVSATSLASPACQDRISQLCGNTAAASPTVAFATMTSCIRTNAPSSFYHQNWHVRAKRVECPAALTRVTGCRLAPQGLPQADPTARTAASAGSDFVTGYTTTTMQDCCKPSCAWSDQVAGAGLTPVGKFGAFYSCDQNGVPITAP